MAKRPTKGSTGTGGAEYKPLEPAPTPMLTVTIETPSKPAHSHELGITVESVLDRLRAEYGADHWTCITLTLTAVGRGGEKEWLIDKDGVRVPRMTVEAYQFGPDESDLHNGEGERHYADPTATRAKDHGRQPPRKGHSKGHSVGNPRPS